MNIFDLLFDVRHYGVKRTQKLHKVVAVLDTQTDVNRFVCFWHTNTFEGQYDANTWIDTWFTKLCVEGKTPKTVYREIFAPVMESWVSESFADDDNIARDKAEFTAKVAKEKQFVDNFVDQYSDLINAVCPKVKL